RVQPRHIGLMLRPLAQPDKRPQHRAHRLREGRLAMHRIHRIVAVGHRQLPFCTEACSSCGACATGVPTSKNVYDSVMVFTSLGSFGSITNTTGISRASFD